MKKTIEKGKDCPIIIHEKTDYFQQLIRQLMHPSLNQGGFSAHPLIQKLTDRFYPKAKAASLKNGGLEGVV